MSKVFDFARLGRGGPRRLLLALALAATTSGAAFANPQTPTPQPPDQHASDIGPNFITITEISDSDLHVHMSFLGYSFTGDLISAFPGSVWTIGPHFDDFISPSLADNSVNISRVFWVTPGGDGNPADDTFSGITIGGAFGGNSAPNIDFINNLTVTEVSNQDPSNVWRDGVCRANNAFTGCPFLANGGSQIVPMFVQTSGGDTFQAPETTITFTDARFGGGVPEPAAWALMILGFAGVGASLRARRPVAV